MGVHGIAVEVERVGQVIDEAVPEGAHIAVGLGVGDLSLGDPGELNDSGDSRPGRLARIWGGSLLADLGYPTLEFTTNDGSDLNVPTQLEAGRYHIIFNNQSDHDFDLEVYQLPEGLTNDDLIALFEEAFGGEGPPEIPDVFYDVVFNGGVSSLPGEMVEVVLDLFPGEWTFNLYNYDPETDENANNSMAVNVTGEMPAIEPPAEVIEIGMGEMYFEVSLDIVAGPQVWRQISEGQQPHYLILASVPKGTTVDQVMELSMAYMEPPASPVAAPMAPPARRRQRCPSRMLRMSTSRYRWQMDIQTWSCSISSQAYTR